MAYNTEYNATVKAGESSVDIKVVPNERIYKSISANGRAVYSGVPFSVSLEKGDNAIPIVVTTLDGATKTYNVRITRPF